MHVFSQLYSRSTVNEHPVHACNLGNRLVLPSHITMFIYTDMQDTMKATIPLSDSIYFHLWYCIFGKYI